MDNYYKYKYIKYKRKYNQLAGLSFFSKIFSRKTKHTNDLSARQVDLSGSIKSILYRSAFLSRLSYEPPIYYLIVLNSFMKSFHNECYEKELSISKINEVNNL